MGAGNPPPCAAPASGGFDVRDVMDTVVRQFAEDAARRGTRLAHEVPAGVPLALAGDAAPLRGALAALVGNTLAVTERGRVDVRITDHERIGRDMLLRFEVQGTGAVPDIADARATVTAAGGEIGVERRPGRVTAAWFTLPVALAADEPPAPTPCPAAPPPPRHAAAGVRRRLLLVDDTALGRDLIAAMLTAMGHEVTAVAGGAEAVAAVAGRPFDLVLMDMQMPGMHGTEATRRIRALPPPAGRLPVIALTADASPENRRDYMAAGLTDLMVKPIDWDELNGMIARATAAGSIDAARLDALATSLGNAEFGAMLAGVRGELASQLATAHAAAREGDGDSVCRVAHALRGMAGNFGLTAIARAAGDAAGRTDPASLLSRLEAAAADTMRALDHWRARR